MATRQFRHDRPTSLEGHEDAFEHRDYATALTEILTTAEPPSTVGLFGPWGVGKSSILLDVKRRLSNGWAFVLFDAWRYEGDALRRHFLKEAASQLKSAGQLHSGYD